MLLNGATQVPDLSTLVTALQTAITPAQVLTILSSIVGVGMGFFLMWLGVRKALKMFVGAVRSGKLRI